MIAERAMHRGLHGSLSEETAKGRTRRIVKVRGWVKLTPARAPEPRYTARRVHRGQGHGHTRIGHSKIGGHDGSGTRQMLPHVPGDDELGSQLTDAGLHLETTRIEHYH